MKLDHPAASQHSALKELWKEAFHDTDASVDAFFRTGFAPSRCRCIMVDGSVAAALYWLDMTCRGQRVAYIYAVATKKAFQGRGLCRALMENTHIFLRSRGYDTCVLSPASAGLFAMYESMGYSLCASLSEIHCNAGTDPLPQRAVDAESYNTRRRALLPSGGLELGKEALAYLASFAELYSGDGVALAGYRDDDGQFHGIELLPDASAAPEILTALGCESGTFRIPGQAYPHAMYYPLHPTAEKPAYLGIAFD